MITDVYRKRFLTDNAFYIRNLIRKNSENITPNHECHTQERRPAVNELSLWMYTPSVDAECNIGAERMIPPVYVCAFPDSSFIAQDSGFRPTTR